MNLTYFKTKICEAVLKYSTLMNRKIHLKKKLTAFLRQLYYFEYSRNSSAKGFTYKSIILKKTSY